MIQSGIKVAEEAEGIMFFIKFGNEDAIKFDFWEVVKPARKSAVKFVICKDWKIVPANASKRKFRARENGLSWYGDGS